VAEDFPVIGGKVGEHHAHFTAIGEGVPIASFMIVFDRQTLGRQDVMGWSFHVKVVDESRGG
jgi:hypothetical protein